MKSRILFLSMLVVAIVLAVMSSAAAENQNDQFYDAIRNNDLVRLDFLVRSADINATDGGGYTPLMYSAAVGSVDAMKRLVSKGANVNAQSTAGITSLILSATDINKVRLLLDRGANVNAATGAIDNAERKSML